jgi:dGTPase
MFSTPLRRLQDKAQVFPLDSSDAVRTRLTHSLEVSTVARSLARQAAEQIRQSTTISDELKPSPDQVRSIETIAATCGLLHDLGNPPFGHSGEDAIQEWFQDGEGRGALDSAMSPELRADFLKFEGNAQTLRLITRLQVLADDNGLNLSFGTLSAALKYTADAATANRLDSCKARQKPGFFSSEKHVVDEIRGKTGTGDARNPIAFIVEAADDLVYSAGDLEDAVKKGLMPWDSMRDEVVKEAERQGREAQELLEKVMKSTKNQLESQKSRSKTSLPVQGDAYATAFRIQVHRLAVPSVLETFKNRYGAIMSGHHHAALADEGEAGTLVRVCKETGKKHVYVAKPTPRLELLGRRVLQDLMTVYWEAAMAISDGRTTKFSKKIESLISRNYIAVAQAAMERAEFEGGLPRRYHALQLVTDFVCGMTDTYARDRHRELFNR